MHWRVVERMHFEIPTTQTAVPSPPTGRRASAVCVSIPAHDLACPAGRSADREFIYSSVVSAERMAGRPAGVPELGEQKGKSEREG